MSTTDIKRYITSKTMVNYLFCHIAHRARHFEVEAPHGTLLTLVTDCRADKTFVSSGTHRTGGQDKDSEDSALSNMQIAS